MKMIFFLGLLIFISTPSPAAVDSSTSSLNLESLFQMVKNVDPTIRKANSKMVELSETGKLARSNFFPALLIQSTILTNQLTVVEKLWDGGATFASSSLAEHEEKVAGSEKKSGIRRLHALVTESYYDALLSIQRAEILEKDTALVNHAIEYAEKQLKFRAIGRNLLLKAQVAKRKNDSALFEAHNQRIRAARNLSRLTQKEDFQLDQLTERLDPHSVPPIPELTPDDLAKKTLAISPEIQSLENQKEAEVARKNISLSDERLHVSLVAAYGLGQDNPPKSIYPGYQSGFNFGAYITFPIFTGLSSVYKDHISIEKTQQIEQDLFHARSTIDFETKEMLNQLKQDSDDLTMTENEVKYSQKMWDEINTEFQAGLSTPDLWFDALSNLETWKLQQLVKTRDYMVKQIELTDSLKESNE